MFTPKILQHYAWYAQSCLQKCLTFHYEPNKRLPVQNQQSEQSCSQLTLKTIERRKNIINIDILNTEQLSHLIHVLKLLILNK